MLINPILLRLPRHQLETALSALQGSLETAKKIEQRASAVYARRPLPGNRHDLDEARTSLRGIENVILTFTDALAQKAREHAE